MPTFEPCAGCAAEFAPYDGPVHRYIGAHPACWALYSEYLSVGSPDASLLRNSRYSALGFSNDKAPPELGALVVDAYAAQHHGEPSPQAIRSVAVHLLVLHGVVAESADVSSALWIRNRALRKRGGFEWLMPPAKDSALALRGLWHHDGSTTAVSPAVYVASVYESWARMHAPRLAEWYRDFVRNDRP